MTRCIAASSMGVREELTEDEDLTLSRESGRERGMGMPTDESPPALPIDRPCTHCQVTSAFTGGSWWWWWGAFLITPSRLSPFPTHAARSPILRGTNASPLRSTRLEPACARRCTYRPSWTCRGRGEGRGARRGNSEGKGHARGRGEEPAFARRCMCRPSWTCRGRGEGGGYGYGACITPTIYPHSAPETPIQVAGGSGAHG